MEGSQRLDVSPEELERLAALVVRHLLFKQHSQPGVPVKREELVELLHREYPNLRGLLAHALPLAGRMARERLGFEIFDLTSGPSGAGDGPASQQERLSSQRGAGGSGKLFVLRSTLSPEMLRRYVLTEDVEQRMALRLTVCAIIHGAGGSIPEEAFWKLLRRTGIRQDAADHPVFGNIKDAMHHLVKERYIASSKGHADDGSETTCFVLGPQALIGIGEQAIKEYYEKICTEGNSI